MSERENEEIVIHDIDTLFEVLNDKNTNYKKVSYSNELLDKIHYKIDIKALDKNTQRQLKGFITPDISNACITKFQNAINSIYAYYVYEKDARSLTDEDKTNLQCSFYIKEGSTILEVVVESIKEICKNLKDLPMKTQLLILASIVSVCCMLFAYKTVDSNNEAKKFLSNNQLIEKIIKDNNETIIKALTSKKMILESVQYNDDEPISGDEMYNYANELNKRKKRTKEKQLEKHLLIVTKLYNDKNNIKMAHLHNSDIDIDVDFVANLFQEKQSILTKSFINNTAINCKLLITRNEDDEIIEATLMNIVDE